VIATGAPPVAASMMPASTPAAAAPAVVPAVATVPPAASAWFVQAGAFANLANAERLREALARFGDTSIGQTTGATGLQLYRVRIGPYTTEDQAYNVRSALERAGHGEAKVVLD
jgi:rare lipoprotein A